MARGLAAGGIASLGQLQLLKPLLGLGISATLLSETVSPVMIMITLGVILCVICSSRFVHQATTTSSVLFWALKMTASDQECGFYCRVMLSCSISIGSGDVIRVAAWKRTADIKT